MRQIRVTILIDVPEGVATPDVDYAEVPQEPAHVAEFAPIGSRPYDRDEVVTPQTIRDAPAPLCQHGIPMKRYPAGVSKSTNKPFNASWRPSDDDCPTKPLWDKTAA